MPQHQRRLFKIMQARKKNKNIIFIRALSVFLAVLIVAGSLAALIQLL